MKCWNQQTCNYKTMIPVVKLTMDIMSKLTEDLKKTAAAAVASTSSSNGGSHIDVKTPLPCSTYNKTPLANSRENYSPGKPHTPTPNRTVNGPPARLG